MDFAGALASVQQWIGTEVSASASVAGGPEYVRATGVIGTPELLWENEDEQDGEYWIFPLAGGGSFALARSVFLDAAWETPGVSLRVQLATGELAVELA